MGDDSLQKIEGLVMARAHKSSRYAVVLKKIMIGQIAFFFEVPVAPIPTRVISRE